MKPRPTQTPSMVSQRILFLLLVIGMPVALVIMLLIGLSGR